MILLPNHVHMAAKIIAEYGPIRAPCKSCNGDCCWEERWDIRPGWILKSNKPHGQGQSHKCSDCLDGTHPLTAEEFATPDGDRPNKYVEQLFWVDGWGIDKTIQDDGKLSWTAFNNNSRSADTLHEALLAVLYAAATAGDDAL